MEFQLNVGKDGSSISQKIQADNFQSNSDQPGEWRVSQETPGTWTLPIQTPFQPSSRLPTLVEQIPFIAPPVTPAPSGANQESYSDFQQAFTGQQSYGIYRQSQLLWKAYHGTVPSMWDMRAYTYWALDKGHSIEEIELDIRCKKEISDAAPNPPASTECVGYTSPADLGDGKSRN